MRKTLALTAVCALALSGCAKTLEAPSDQGVCYAMATLKDGNVRFNALASKVPDLEHCAADLEAMRVRFNQLGASNKELTGAYQGQFIFLQPEGVFTSSRYSGIRYPFLVRTGDGRLAPPGAVQ